MLDNFSSLDLDTRGRNESLMRMRLWTHWSIDLFVAHYKVSGICRVFSGAIMSPTETAIYERGSIVELDRCGCHGGFPSLQISRNC